MVWLFCFNPSAIDEAMIFNTAGPTAVVIKLAVATASVNAAGFCEELIADTGPTTSCFCLVLPVQPCILLFHSAH